MGGLLEDFWGFVYGLGYVVFWGYKYYEGRLWCGSYVIMFFFLLYIRFVVIRLFEFWYSLVRKCIKSELRFGDCLKILMEMRCWWCYGLRNIGVDRVKEYSFICVVSWFWI